MLQLLRWLLYHPHEAGMSAGLIHRLAHPKPARELTAVHESPGVGWTLDSMAQAPGMSRSACAAEFKRQLGTAPTEYQLHCRVSIGQSMLISRASIKTTSEKLGHSLKPNV